LCWRADDDAELLMSVAKNTLNHVSLGDLTLGAFTKVRRSKVLKAEPPERRIQATLEYRYFTPTWATFTESATLGTDAAADSSARDRDIRAHARDLLEITTVFDSVWLSEESGQAATDQIAAEILPMTDNDYDRYDDDGTMATTGHARLAVIARHEDQQTRDDIAERALYAACDTLNGRSLAGWTLPHFTRVASWKWAKPEAPERRIDAVLEYQYLNPDWTSFDVGE
jgi:hypothetical protein